MELECTSPALATGGAWYTPHCGTGTRFIVATHCGALRWCYLSCCVGTHHFRSHGTPRPRKGSQRCVGNYVITEVHGRLYWGRGSGVEAHGYGLVGMQGVLRCLCRGCFPSTLPGTVLAQRPSAHPLTHCHTLTLLHTPTLHFLAVAFCPHPGSLERHISSPAPPCHLRVYMSTSQVTGVCLDPPHASHRLPAPPCHPPLQTILCLCQARLLVQNMLRVDQSFRFSMLQVLLSALMAKCA